MLKLGHCVNTTVIQWIHPVNKHELKNVDAKTINTILLSLKFFSKKNTIPGIPGIPGIAFAVTKQLWISVAPTWNFK